MHTLNFHPHIARLAQTVYCFEVMDSVDQQNTIAAEYSARIAAQKLRWAESERRHKYLGFVKLALAAITLIIFALALRSSIGSVLWIIVPIVALIALERFHARVIATTRHSQRIISFYESGLARIENRWMNGGGQGMEFVEATHPYARDLDVFGEGSLYELLCTARTAAGKSILAQWLLSPASLQEVRERQQAVQELKPQLDFRQDLAVSGVDIRSRARAEGLLEWAEAPPILKLMPARAAAGALSIIFLFSLLLWAITGLWEAPLLVAAINRYFHSRFRMRAIKIFEAETFAREFALLPAILARIEQEKFSSSKLAALQTQLRQHGLGPSASIRKLRWLVESLESRRNLFLKVIDPFILWSTQIAFAIEAWRQNSASAFRPWLSAIGEIEALNALANYAYEHPADSFPEFIHGAASFSAEGMAHPLLPRDRSIRNVVKLGGASANNSSSGSDLRLMIITGPNMSGKSTFARSIGLNAVLAQCGAPVCADKLTMSPLQVCASICVLDSLQGGVSRFYAEITRLKLIAELAQHSMPVLFLLDELLSGTNSDDRHTGAEAFVKILLARGAIGLVTTHDLALTQIAENTALQAKNFHFEDRIENGELRFDYRIAKGVAHSSNALKLMRSMGLDV